MSNKTMDNAALNTAAVCQESSVKEASETLGIPEATIQRYLRHVNQKFPDVFNQKTRKAKILLFDIENAPNVAHTWGIWKVNVAINQIIEPWYILSWAAKWLGEDEIFWDSLANHPKEYKKDSRNDKAICLSMWDLLNQADIVITHNGIHHDIPKLKSQFIKHGIKPYSPVKHIDTCRSARGMGFTSRKLQFIAKHLGIGQKLAHTGHQLWIDCMDPKMDIEAWNLMVEYNCVDVELLEGVYLKLRPWINNHPNINLYSEPTEVRCTKCGGRVEMDGDAATPATTYQAYVCTECGTWSRSRYQKMTTEQKQKILANYL